MSTLDDIPIAAHDRPAVMVVRDVDAVDGQVADAGRAADDVHVHERQLVGTDGRAADASDAGGSAGTGGPDGSRPSLWQFRDHDGPSSSGEPAHAPVEGLDGRDAPRETPSLEQAVAERFPDKTLHAETSGQTGSWNTALHRLEPDSVYVVDERNVYVTDSLGRVEHVEARWEPTARTEAEDRRNSYQQMQAGGADRRATDVGGHLLAAGGGGGGEGFNLVAMDRVLNSGRGAYGKMEALIRSIARSSPGAEIDLSIDVLYPGSSLRPDYLSVDIFVDGVYYDRVGAPQ